MNAVRASLIISVYKDVEALNCIFQALKQQTEKSFQVIVTEDGCDPEMARLVSRESGYFPSVLHLTQEDRGFRKTVAVNRAIIQAKSSFLIFLDGDCIPHQKFIESHLEHAEMGKISTARRMHLGARTSELCRKNPDYVGRYWHWYSLFLRFLPLHIDGVRNYEVGAPSSFFHKIAQRRHLSIVGCNFSCFKEDMEKINGYDEDLPGVGGEDCDLEWRFNGVGVVTKNIKFCAITYHLYHESRRADAEVNVQISQRNRELKKFFCKNGLKKTLT